MSIRDRFEAGVWRVASNASKSAGSGDFRASTRIGKGRDRAEVERTGEERHVVCLK